MMVRESEFEQLRRVPEDLREIDARLRNWAAWSRDKMRQGHCRSIEFRYVAPRIKEAEDLQATAPPDVLDAAAMHPIVCLLPYSHRWVLHLHLIHRAPPNFIRRKLGLRQDELAYELNRARTMARNIARKG